MAWFNKKNDPITDKARSLNDEIARLEAEIAKLDGQLQRKASEPRLRPAAMPGGHASHAPAARGPEPEPIFEEVDVSKLTAQGEDPSNRSHYNELGVRKYDLPALFSRIRNHFRGPAASNPKLVSYLAAGGIQGLRPLRYEKRVARNRFIVLVIVLFLTLLGLIWIFVKNAR